MLEKMERILSIREVCQEFIGAQATDKIWSAAEEDLARLLKKYGEFSKKESRHTGLIFAHIAVYKALMKDHADVAMKIMEQGEAACVKNTAKTYQKIVRMPFGKTLFFKIFALGCKSGFGPESGFANVVHKANNRVYQMDVTACPYAKYCKAEGCYELTHIFCDNDIYAYGSLDGIAFTRTQTLGRNGEKCDFLLERKA